MKRLVLIPLIGAVLLGVSCNESSSKKKTKEIQVNPWEIFYKLVPNVPKDIDVIGEGSYDIHANPVINKFILFPQVNLEINEIIKDFGEPETISDYKNLIPVVLSQKLPEFNPVQLGEGSYQYNDISGKSYNWGKISFLVRNGKVFLIFVNDSEAKPKIFAKQIERK